MNIRNQLGLVVFRELIAPTCRPSSSYLYWRDISFKDKILYKIDFYQHSMFHYESTYYILVYDLSAVG